MSVLPLYHIGFLRGYLADKNPPADVKASIDALYAAAVQGTIVNQEESQQQQPAPAIEQPAVVRQVSLRPEHEITARGLGISVEELHQDLDGVSYKTEATTEPPTQVTRHPRRICP